MTMMPFEWLKPTAWRVRHTTDWLPASRPPLAQRRETLAFLKQRAGQIRRPPVSRKPLPERSPS